jgi:hypothetical protein
MNTKLFFSIFLAILAGGAGLYLLFHWQKRQEEAQRRQEQAALKRSPRREIGFLAILKEQNASTANI